MKLTTNLIEKFGADKLLHFLTTAWLVSEAKVFGINAMIITYFVVVILGIIKEIKLDEYRDNCDIIASAAGGFVSVMFYIIWFYIL